LPLQVIAWEAAVAPPHANKSSRIKPLDILAIDASTLVQLLVAEILSMTHPTTYEQQQQHANSTHLHFAVQILRIYITVYACELVAFSQIALKQRAHLLQKFWQICGALMHCGRITRTGLPTWHVLIG
jgi:hypothetical protein